MFLQTKPKRRQMRSYVLCSTDCAVLSSLTSRTTLLPLENLSPSKKRAPPSHRTGTCLSERQTDTHTIFNMLRFNSSQLSVFKTFYVIVQGCLAKVKLLSLNGSQARQDNTPKKKKSCHWEDTFSKGTPLCLIQL